ncbi:MAG: WYL domain-containing transcriptional regulator [Haliangiales bacterium]
MQACLIMPRGNQITRQWRILRLLEGARQGLRAREIYESLTDSASERTIFRDLQDLQAAGFPLYEEGGRWRVLSQDDGGYQIPVEPSELLALLLSEELLAPMRGVEVVCALTELREKIAAMLTPTGRAYAQELKGQLIATLIGPGEYGSSELLRTIEDAMHRGHQLQIRYWKPPDQHTERRVDPYLFWYSDARLYLVGHCHLRGTVRTFHLDRIRHAEELDVAFDVDPHFDPQQFTQSGMGAWTGERYRVELWFTQPVAHLAYERRFHPSQQVEEEPLGGARVVMHVAGLPHVAAWVASFGGQVVARGPVALIEHIKAIHRRGLAAYEGGVPAQ